MAGIYIHIPFCKQKCTYCAFHFSTNLSYIDRMVQAICTEIAMRATELATKKIATLYFGGGSPSILNKEQLGIIFTTLHRHFNLDNCVECTLEANPDDITREKVRFWKDLGINRLSIGIQSFDAVDLEWMNRAHTVEQSKNSIRIAQEEGINNLTIDLMYGLPQQSLDKWKNNIQQALEFGIHHISAYCLTVEERTALYKKVQKEELLPLDQDLQNEQFDLLVSTLESNGFIHYEISNYAKEGYVAVHNTNYWTGKKYLGIGPSAHSFDGKRRLWNISNNHVYMREIEAKNLPLEIEDLSPENLFNELLLTGLRTIWGVHLDELNQRYPISAEFNKKLEAFLNKGWIELTDNTLILTQEGKHLADHITEELFVV